MSHCGTPSRRVAIALLAMVCSTRAFAQDVRGVTDTEVLLGMSAVLSGPTKDLGQQMKVGIETAFAAQNEAGGVNGRKLTLIAADDNMEPEKAKAVMRQLVEQRKVFAVVGNVGTATAMATLPYILEKGMILFGPLSGGDFLRNDPPDRFIYNFRASYLEETAVAVKYLVEVRNIKPNQIAVFAQEDSYGENGFEGVAWMMRKYKRDPAQVLRVGYKRNTTDVSEAVKTIRANASKLRAIVMIPTARAAARFIQKIKEENLELLFTTTSAGGANEMAEQLTQLGPRYADGVIVTHVVPLPTSHASAILKYREALARYTPAEKPSFGSLEGYIAAGLFIEGLRRAGKNLTTDSLVAALESIKNLDMGIGTPLTFSPSEHQASHKVWLTILDGHGVYKAVHADSPGHL